MPVITAAHPAKMQAFHWGLIPSWVKDREQAKEIKLKGSTLNAKSETAFELPSFKESIANRRCLVPANGFFEWRQDTYDKVPHFISLRNSETFAMAGIYDSWIDRESGKEVKSFSILTCEANPMMKKIHNIKMRMPVILPKAMEQQWLRADLSQTEIQKLLLAYPEEQMQAWTISKLISSRETDTNTPEVLKKVDYAQQGSLF